MKYDYNALMKEIYEEVRALGIPVSGNIEPEVQINTRAKNATVAVCDYMAKNMNIESRSQRIWRTRTRIVCAAFWRMSFCTRARAA